MGYIREPKGVDFVVENKPVTVEDRKMISAIIAYYKATGRKMPVKKSITSRLNKKSGTRSKKIHSA